MTCFESCREHHHVVWRLSLVIIMIAVGVVGCNWVERKQKESPTGPSGSAEELGNYAQMEDGSLVVGGHQLNWVFSDWGPLPYVQWLYLEVNEQDAIGQPPGDHQVPVTLMNVVLSFRGLPDEVSHIMIGVKAVRDPKDDTFTERGRFAVLNGEVNIPLDYGDLVYYFGITHYSIWFQVFGGQNEEGMSANATVTLSGIMPGGQGVTLSTQVRFGTNPEPVMAAPPGDADGDGVPDGSDNCPSVANPQQMATDPNSGCRLIDNNNGTVTDITTGLMWEQTPTNLSQDWCTAITTCDTLVKAGYSDWRLASKTEWQVLTGGTCNTCGDWMLPLGHPFSGVSLWYWMSTPTTATCPGTSGRGAWTVHFGLGYALDFSQTTNLAVWCIRG